MAEIQERSSKRTRDVLMSQQETDGTTRKSDKPESSSLLGGIGSIRSIALDQQPHLSLDHRGLRVASPQASDQAIGGS